MCAPPAFRARSRSSYFFLTSVTVLSTMVSLYSFNRKNGENITGRRHTVAFTTAASLPPPPGLGHGVYIKEDKTMETVMRRPQVSVDWKLDTSLLFKMAGEKQKHSAVLGRIYWDIIRLSQEVAEFSLTFLHRPSVKVPRTDYRFAEKDWKLYLS